MAEPRDEIYVIDPATTQRAAVPRKHYESALKAKGWVIDPDGPSAAQAAPQAVRAAEKRIEKAAEKRAAGEGE